MNMYIYAFVYVFYVCNNRGKDAIHLRGMGKERKV